MGMRALALVFPRPVLVPIALTAAFVVASLPACGEDAGSNGDGSGVTAKPIPVDVGASGNTSTAGTATTSSGKVTPPAPAPTADIDLSTVTTTFNGISRVYDLGLPKGYDANRAYPLVMLFHGNPGTKEEMRGFAPFDKVSKRDAILVYPNGLGGAWDLYTPTDTNNDMNWIRALPAEIASKYHVDQSRVYGFGFSGGAFMMAQMGCRFGQSAFRAVYINSGGGPEEAQAGYSQRADKCYVCPGGPLPTLIVHGDVDGTVVKASGGFTSKCVSETNGCSEPPSQPVSPSPCLAAPNCQKPVEWCLIPNMGHEIWSQGMQAAWDFFRAN
jgi:polyhydroxybutyrate depolymerase